VTSFAGHNNWHPPFVLGSKLKSTIHLSRFLRSGIAQAPFVARGLPEQLSSLGDRLSSFRRSGIARAPFVARGLPELLSPLGDCPSSLRRSGIVAPGSPGLRDCLSTFFGVYFLLLLEYLILLDWHIYWYLSDCATSAKGNYFLLNHWVLE
jgi:hypothetical protein